MSTYWYWTAGRDVIPATRVPVPIVPTPVEPVTIAQARRQLQGATEPDEDVERWIRAARFHVEKRTGLALVPQTWDLRLYIDSSYIYPGWITLPHTPTTAIDGVWTIDAAGVETLVSSGAYWLNAAMLPAALIFTSALVASHGIRVRYSAGLADAATVPPDLLAAIYWQIVHLSAHRGDEPDVPDEPLAVTRLLDQYVLPGVA